MGDGYDRQRVPVGRRVRRDFRADDAAGAAAVVDDDLLAQVLAQVRGDHAPDHVVAAAGRERNDEPHRLHRIVLRRRRGREREQESGSLEPN